MLLQTNSYIVPKEKRVQHARLMRRFRQTMHRLGCDQFEAYEQVAANWNAAGESGRFVQIMRFRDRRHQQAVQIAEREDPGAQQLIAEFCNLINLPYQHQHGYFATGFYTSVPGVAPAPIEEYYEDEVVEEEAAAPEAQAAGVAYAQPTAEAGEATEPAHDEHTPAEEFAQSQPAFGQAHPEGQERAAREAQAVPDSLPEETARPLTEGAVATDATETEISDEAAAPEMDQPAGEGLLAEASDLKSDHDAPAPEHVALADDFDALLDSELKPASGESDSAAITAETPEVHPEAELDLEALDFDEEESEAAEPLGAQAATDSPELTAEETDFSETLDAAVAEEAPGEGETAAPEDSEEVVELELAAPEVAADFAELTIAVPSAENDVVTVNDVLAARHAHEHEEAPEELAPVEVDAQEPDESATNAQVQSGEPEPHDDRPVIPTIGDAHHSGGPFDEQLAEDLRLSAPASHARTNGHPAPAGQSLSDEALFEQFLKELDKESAPDANSPAR
ncbi:MAG: hypothetical protein JWN24_2440 [Phycisphaerales bacterium]|nr:hypothetical protein [Phycisphaerales bacterium]